MPAPSRTGARIDSPTVILYGGTVMPRQCRANDGTCRVLTVQDVFEAVGAHAAGRIGDADLHEMERHACPGAGACGGQFTANTMAMVLTFLGLSPLGANDIPAMHADKPAAAKACGELVMQRLRDSGPTPRDLLSPVADRKSTRLTSSH